MSNSDLSRAPWRTIADAALAPAAGVPTMLSPEERRLYYWLAHERIGGPGAVADLGSFVGGSTALLAQGLTDGGWPARIHLFDRFTASEKVKRSFLYPAGIAPFVGDDILPLSRRLLSPWADRLRWHKGEITDLRYPDNAYDIRLLILDLCKVPGPSDHVAAAFLPRLCKGAVVVQKDMLQWNQPWTAVQMLLLLDWLQPLTRVSTAMLFRCTAVPTAAALRDATIADLDDKTLIAGLSEAQRRFERFDVRHIIERMIAVVRANPGVREPWHITDPGQRDTIRQAAGA